MMVSEAVLVAAAARRARSIVEFDALADAVRSAPQDHDLAPGRRVRLALLLVGRVEVGGGGGELRRAGVDTLVHGPDAERVTLVADRLLRHVHQARQAAVGEALALEYPQALGAERPETLFAHLGFLPHQLLDLPPGTTDRCG